MVFSPLGLVPKKSRGISSHSCFSKENSVNSHFAPECSAVSFDVHDHCIRIMLELGQGCLVTYGMLSGSFPFPLLTIACCSSLRGLPIGCSTSCQTFQSLSQAVQWICLHKANISHISHIIDDFIFFANTYSQCQFYLESFF